MNLEEKIGLRPPARAPERGCDRGGFPSSSPGDFESVKKIAQEIRGPQIAGLARTTPTDIDRAWEALRYARNPLLHVFIATSDIHLKHKLRKSREEVLEEAGRAVAHAKTLHPGGGVLRRRRHPLRSRLPGPGHRGRHRGRGAHRQHPRYGGLHHPHGVRKAAHRPPAKGEEYPQGRHLGSLPRRSGNGGGQQPGRRGKRRPPGGVHGERHRRARRATPPWKRSSWP